MDIQRISDAIDSITKSLQPGERKNTKYGTLAKLKDGGIVCLEGPTVIRCADGRMGILIPGLENTTTESPKNEAHD